MPSATTATAAATKRTMLPTQFLRMALSGRRFPLFGITRVSFHDMTTGRRGPALNRRLVACLDVHPDFPIRLLDLFPERGAGFEIIHQKFGRRERRFAMRRSGRHHHDVLARHNPAMTMNDSDAQQW